MIGSNYFSCFCFFVVIVGLDEWEVAFYIFCGIISFRRGREYFLGFEFFAFYSNKSENFRSFMR